MPTPQIGQTHSNNLSAVADKLFECVWPFCGLALKGLQILSKSLTTFPKVPSKMFASVLNALLMIIVMFDTWKCYFMFIDDINLFDWYNCIPDILKDILITVKVSCFSIDNFLTSNWLYACKITIKLCKKQALHLLNQQILLVSLSIY